jgi:hypothetical protein
VEIYLQEEHVYDTQSNYKSAIDTYRCIVNINIFRDITKLNINMYNQFIQTIAIILKQSTGFVLNVVCCNKFDISTDMLLSNINLVNELSELINWTLMQKGIVKISDFALIIAKPILERLNIVSPVESLVSDINGEVAASFNPLLMQSSGLLDLQLLGKISTSGRITLHSMASTRRMVPAESAINSKVILTSQMGNTTNWVSVNPSNGEWVKYNPSFPNPNWISGVPLMFLVETSTGGKIILFSLHFCELSKIDGVDTAQLIESIKQVEGESSSLAFAQKLNDSNSIEEKQAVISNGLLNVMLSAGSTPSPYELR